MRHVPWPRFKPPHPGGECAYGTEVDDVAAEDRLQRLVELARDERLHASLVGRELLLPRDLVVVARAAETQDAAFAVERDLVGQRDRLLEVEPRPVDPARRVAVPECEVLQRTLAALVADRAVEGMVGELELEHVSPRSHGKWRLRLHDHAFGGRCAACDAGDRRPGRDLHDAQATRPDVVELVVVTEHRYLDPELLCRLHDQGARRYRDRSAVDSQRYVRHHPLRRCAPPPQRVERMRSPRCRSCGGRAPRIRCGSG